jgi:hypothetical protein
MTPKQDSEKLIDVVLPFAEQMLSKYGEFYPFSAVMIPSDEIELLGVLEVNEYPESQTLIDDIEALFIHGAMSGKYKATALAYMAGVPTGTGEEGDAICVKIDHVDNYSVTVVFQYLLEGENGVTLLPPSAIAGNKNIFI